jgi:photosystem II stability/assembly factor-like uncharacterized protein
MFPSFSSIYFINEKTGWAVEIDGGILATIDGGQHWQRQQLPYGAEGNLKSVFFINEKTGWAVGYGQISPVVASLDGVILATTDGGQHWQRQEIDFYINLRLTSVYFVNEKTGWAVGGEVIIGTTDGGQHWQLLDNGDVADAEFNSIYFVNEKIGWVVGGRTLTNIDESVILATTDGGQIWQRQRSELHTTLRSVHFVDEKTGWAVGKRVQGYSDLPEILATTDGGENWRQQITRDIGGGIASLSSVHFTNEKTGWAVGLKCMLLSEFKESAPYPSTFSVIDNALTTTIRYRVLRYSPLSRPKIGKFKVDYC